MRGVFGKADEDENCCTGGTDIHKHVVGDLVCAFFRYGLIVDAQHDLPSNLRVESS